MATSVLTFRATEQVAHLILDCVSKQYPKRKFALDVLPSHDRGSTQYCEIRIEEADCPDEIRQYLADYVGRLFPDKARSLGSVQHKVA